MEGSSTSLCELCQTAFETVYANDWGRKAAFETVHANDWKRNATYNTDIKRLKSSATAGCILCTRFIDFSKNYSFVQESVNSICYIINASRSYFPGPETNWSIKESNAKLLDDEISSFQLLKKLESNKEDQGNNARRPSPNTRDALPLCKAWLGMCFQKHNACGLSHQENLPTRLVYLPEVIDQASIRLVELHELSDNLQYATLSHCWGRKPFLKLLKHNYEKFRRHIPFEDLPKTFQDTMNIVKYLGIRYLWIDSLCIIQDDEEDWRKESSVMASVYGNSLVNIAASDAINGSVGCFFDRDSTWDMEIGFKIGEKQFTYSCFDGKNKTFRSTLQLTPLASRGWAMQERILSPRTIHFTKSEVFWECREIASENFPSGVPFFLGFFQFQKKLESLKAWFDMVEEYSSCKLSFEEDKLVAIAGLAKYAQSQLSDEYLAGHWRKDLVKQLLWEVAETEEQGIYTAPSWSWASIKGKVNSKHFGHHGDIICAKVEDVKIDYITDPFGAVSGGRLRLGCRHLISERLSLKRENGVVEWTNSQGVEGFKLSFDRKSATRTNKINCFMVVLMNDYVFWRSVYGLVLQPTLKELGNYRRIGSFELPFFGEEGHDFEDEIVEVFGTNATEADCVEIRTNADGGKEYIIDII